MPLERRSLKLLAGLVVGAQIAMAGVVEAAEAPSMELLEFLAEWESEGGEWLDFTQLEAMPLDEAGHDQAQNRELEQGQAKVRQKVRQEGATR
ncbi:MAG: hypothetical protein GXP10_03945 [Gammaproteobacteria bacterium]|nr:hypothetical protein [Gammaproteobacteria bacterium]